MIPRPIQVPGSHALAPRTSGLPMANIEMLMTAPTMPYRSFFSSSIVMRFVMVTVPSPAPAMHDIFMARPSDPFHRKTTVARTIKDDDPEMLIRPSQ